MKQIVFAVIILMLFSSCAEMPKKKRHKKAAVSPIAKVETNQNDGVADKIDDLIADMEANKPVKATPTPTVVPQPTPRPKLIFP